MPYAYGRGTGMGMGRGGGMGFGFRGKSPVWPYVGRGRGGLPRCGYYLAGNAAFSPTQVYERPVYTGIATMPGYNPNYNMSKDEELSFMKNQAEAIKKNLEQIDKRISELESQE